MLKLGILKSKTGKSFSKPMHEAGLRALSVDGEYNVYECLPPDLEMTFNLLKTSGVRGVNVTIPHKVSVIPFLDELTDRAKLTGAVNTIIFEEDGKAIGDNTDLYGFWNAIPEYYRENIAGKNVALFGAGGAASACAIDFILNSVHYLTIYGRDLGKLEKFKLELESKNIKSDTKIKIDLFENLNLEDVFILTNTTPLGMYPDVDSSPVKLEQLKSLPKNALVYDIVYNPRKTVLLKDAESLGLKYLNGLEMLVLQGAESLKLWLKRHDVPIDAMREAVISIPTHSSL